MNNSNELRTFVFENVNALERFDIFIDTVQYGTPAKNEHVKSLPYMSGEYDMDKIIGYPTYAPRTIIYTCQLIEESSSALEEIVTALENWLMRPIEGVLQDTATPTYHFKAKCISIVPAESGEFAEVTITFKAYPFKIKNTSVDAVRWDDINFEHDVFMQTQYEIVKSGTITLENLGAGPVKLNYQVDALVIIKVDGITYQISGSGKAPFLLLPGKNVLNITAISTNNTVTISFDWTEELI